MAHVRQSMPDSGLEANMAHVRQSRRDSGLEANMAHVRQSRPGSGLPESGLSRERDLFIDNLQVALHLPSLMGLYHTAGFADEVISFRGTIWDVFTD